ncbi:hypothetical protein GWI34_13965 [Actinomadura sp. DSM 109109]|nr:hypothetical protein [Actinomadura lepetitiana]
MAGPKLRTGSYYPGGCWSSAVGPSGRLASVVAASYLLGASTRRVEKLAERLGVAKSQFNCL